MSDVKHTVFNTLTLFTSLGTLACCALPALFVALGAGAALAGAVASVPELVWLSENKVALFSVAGAMILLSGILRYKNRHAPCPTDPQKAHACKKLRKVSGHTHNASLAIYATGFFFAFIAPYWIG